MRNIIKQPHEYDATYNHVSRLEASNIYEAIVANIIDALIDQNLFESRRTASGKASYFHLQKESNKTVTATPKKTCQEVNLSITTNNITTTSLDVLEAWNSSNISNTAINAFNIDFDAPVTYRPRPALLSSDSENKRILKITAQLAELKGHINCELLRTFTRSL